MATWVEVPPRQDIFRPQHVEQPVPGQATDLSVDLENDVLVVLRSIRSVLQHTYPRESAKFITVQFVVTPVDGNPLVHRLEGGKTNGSVEFAHLPIRSH